MATSDALRLIRDELNLTQTQLAETLGVSYATVSRWENAKSKPNPSIAAAAIVRLKEAGTSSSLLSYLERSFSEAPDEQNLNKVDLSLANQLIDEAVAAIIAWRKGTYELLYVNRAGTKLISPSGDPTSNICYKRLYGRDTPCDHCMIKDEGAQAEHGRDVTLPNGRTYVFRARNLDWEGTPAHVEYINDVTEIRASQGLSEQMHELSLARHEAERQEHELQMALEFGGMWSWSYNVRTGQASYCRQMTKIMGSRALDMPFPGAVIESHVVVPEHEDIVRQSAERIAANEPSVEFDAQIFYHGTRHWVRCKISALEKNDGVTTTAIGTCRLIDTEKAMEARVQLERERTRKDESNLIAFVVSDITHGVVLDTNMPQPAGDNPDLAHRFEDAVVKALESVVYVDDKLEYLKVHDATYLLEEFQHGRTAFTIEFRSRQADGLITWKRNVLHLVEDPATYNVMLYEYYYDINQTKAVEVVTNAAILETFDCLASIDLVHDQTSFLSQENVRSGRNVMTATYAIESDRFVDRFVVADERDSYRERATIQAIRAELEVAPSFEFTYHIINANGERRTYRNRYTYYDRKKMRCLLMRTDVSDVIADQERAEIERSRAQLLDAIPGGIITFDTALTDGTEQPVGLCSEGVASITGYTPDELRDILRTEPTAVVLPNDFPDLRASLAKCMNDGAPFESTFRIKRADGEVIWVRLITNLMRGADGHDLLVGDLQNISEETYLYRTIIDSADQIVEIIDCDTREVYYANRAACEFSGMDSFLGKRCYEFFGHYDKPCPYCNYVDGKLIEGEIHIDRTGQTFQVRGDFMDWHGHKVFAQYLTDVTHVKAMQNTYQSYAAGLTKAANDAVFVAGVNITKKTCDVRSVAFPDFEPLLAVHDAHELVTRSAATIPDEDVRLACLKAFSSENLISEFHQGNSQVMMRHRCELNNGDIIIMDTNVNLMLNPLSGDIEGIAYARDVTQEAINDQIFNRLASEQFEGVELIDVLTKTCNLREFDPDDERSELARNDDYDDNRLQSANQFMHPDDREIWLELSSLDNIQAHLAQEDTYSFTVRNVIDGMTYVKKCSYCYLGDDHNTIMGTIEDLTDITRESERQKRELSDALEAANQAAIAKSAFLSRMSHDMRTPMNGIIGLTHLASEVDGLPDEAANDLAEIEVSSNFLLGLINDTLEMSKIESGQMTLKEEITNPDVLLDSIMATIKPLADEKNISIEVRDHDMRPHYIWADPVRLQQVFNNLLANAVKFTPEGGHVVFDIACKDIDKDHVHKVIRVIDDGCGMSEDFVSHCFEPFSQENEYSPTGLVGTGLGLSIVRTIVELMGGTIEVESTKGEGTTFTVTLDQLVASEADIEAKDKKAVEVSLTGKRLLLAEDNDINALVATKALEAKGGEVIRAKDGQQAVEMFESSAPGDFDIILMDIRMPRLSGLKAAQAIRALDRADAKDIPIVAMTADAFDKDRDLSREAGMNAHLSKPIDPDKLNETLKAMLG